MTNVARHAQASRAKVCLRKVADAVDLEVSDNGISFKVEKVLNVTRNKRLGLIGMRERAEMVGGTFAIESEPEKGTTLRARIPFANGTRRGS